MTQNNKRELIERLALVDIDLRRSHNGFDFIASLSELEAFAKAYKTASDANDESPISQNEQQEAVGFIDEADDGIFGDVQKGIAEGLCKVGDLLYTSPPKQIPDGWKLVPIEPTPKMVDATWNDDELIKNMSHNRRNKHIYKAMTNAAPTPSETNTEVGE